MSTAVADTTFNLGFLTILQEADSYLGGFLVTNQWGRPLEFRLTSAVQPNRVQQILYSETLEPYICADLIGKTLVEKTPVPVNLIITDNQAALDMRLQMETPVAWVAQNGEAAEETPRPIHCHAQFPDDAQRIDEMLGKLIGGIDLTEPFQRIREAMSEARRMGIKK